METQGGTENMFRIGDVYCGDKFKTGDKSRMPPQKSLALSENFLLD